MNEDAQLLLQYTDERSEGAFRELVARHIDLVYSTALRVAGGDCHLAQDAAQTVFVDLARKAWSLPRDGVLAGWLYRHAWFTAAKMVRTEQRRRNRESIAMEMRALDETTAPSWDHVAPHLDESLNQLSAADRDAVVLRYFKQQDFRAIGAALGVSDDTAQKRVSRALEKLRGLLASRGIALTSAALASGLAAKAVAAAPTGLALSVATTALAGATAVGAGLSLTTIKLMAMTKLQLSVAGVILIAGISTPYLLQRQALNRMRDENSQVRQENQSLREQVTGMAQLQVENQRLSNLVAQAGGAPSLKPTQINELLRLRGEATRLRADVKENAKAANPMLEMLKTPQGKEMMKASMRSMGLQMQKSYGSLFSALHLSAEQTETLKDLILNKFMSGAEMATAAMAGEIDTAQLREQAIQADAQSTAINNQIKQLLGDDNYAQFESYGKTIPERLTLVDLKDQLGAGAKALSADQEQQLTAAILEERQNFQFTTDYSDPSKFTGDRASYYTADRIQQYQQEQAQLAQHYLDRAQGILSADQMAAFQSALASQQARMQANLGIGAKLITGKSVTP